MRYSGFAAFPPVCRTIAAWNNIQYACKVHPPSFLKHCKLSRPIFTIREAELSWVYSVNFYFFGLVLTFVTSYWSLKP